jgi:hypothetical protein
MTEVTNRDRTVATVAAGSTPLCDVTPDPLPQRLARGGEQNVRFSGDSGILQRRHQHAAAYHAPQRSDGLGDSGNAACAEGSRPSHTCRNLKATG